MDLKQGQTNNPNGRPKGSKNKSTEQIRAMVSELFNEQFEQVRNNFSQLDFRSRIKFLIDVMPYVLPRLQTVTQHNIIDIDSLSEKQIEQVVDSILNTDAQKRANFQEWFNEGKE